MGDPIIIGPAAGPAGVLLAHVIRAMDEGVVAAIRAVEAEAAGRPQVPIRTGHVLHAGLYSRTVLIPKGTLITGTLIKIATLLIVAGDAAVFVSDRTVLELKGYNVVPAEAGRKQAIAAQSDVHLTMIFPTSATTVEEAEREFTDEADLLASRRDGASNDVVVTGV